MISKNKVTPICAGCGSDNILFDSWAVWDDDRQDFENVHTSDKNGLCQDCDSSDPVKWVGLPE